MTRIGVTVRGGHGRRDASVASRLDQHALTGRNLARVLPAQRHRNTDPVFHAGYRLKKFELGEQVRLDALLRRSRSHRTIDFSDLSVIKA